LNHKIRIQAIADTHAAGNADHWRKNTPELAKEGFRCGPAHDAWTSLRNDAVADSMLRTAAGRVFAIDLLGYGYSDKPNPQEMGAVNGESTRDLDEYLRFAPPNAARYGGVGETPFTDMAHPVQSGYNFFTWADQVADFTREVVGAPAFLICNSIGSSCGLQTAVDHHDRVRGVQIMDPSLRQLNVKRQNPLGAPFVAALQTVLRETPLGEGFFGVVATENTVRTVFEQIYPRKESVTDELVQCILRPGRTPNAPRVFLDFISYSAGPLPEEQLAILSSDEYKQAGKTTPVSILWGDKDPWEDVTLGRVYGECGPACTAPTRCSQATFHLRPARRMAASKGG